MEEEDERRSVMDRCGTPLSDQSESPDHHTANRGGHVAGMIKVHDVLTVQYRTRV